MNDSTTPRHHSMTMPENHLDTVVSTNSIDPAPSRRASGSTRIVAVVLMPLFFLIVFSLCYTSALHSPKPHDFALTLAGPAETTHSLSSAIQDRAEGAFAISRTTSAKAARDDVRDRSAVGAIIVDGIDVTTVTAGAGGQLAASTVQQVGAQVAAQLGGTSTVQDVAPTTKEDRSGTSLFFFLIVCTIGGYLSNTVLAQVLPRARTRTMLLTAAVAGVLAPLLGFGMISIFVGDFGVTFGTLAAVLGVGMIYTFTIGVLATLFTKLLGQGAIFAVILFLIGINFPSAGGGSPESMLPGFWQVVHNGWVGAGAMESMRSILDFDGHQVGRWMTQLLIWTGGSLLLAGLIALRDRRRGEVDGAEPTAEAPGTAVATVSM